MEAVERYLPDRVDVTGYDAGAHVALWPKQRVSEAKLIAAASRRGVGIYGMSGYSLTKTMRPGFLLGDSRMRENELREGIRLLSEVL